MLLLLIWNFLRRTNCIFTGLVDFNIEIILDPAPSNSKEFEEQLLRSLADLKEKNKDITLGD